MPPHHNGIECNHAYRDLLLVTPDDTIVIKAGLYKGQIIEMYLELVEELRLLYKDLLRIVPGRYTYDTPDHDDSKRLNKSCK